MTREEAIDLLDNLNGMIEDSRNSDYDTAFKMAIKALEQEDCEDCISRQAAIDACLSGWNKDYKEIVEEIRTLPPVTPQPKTGWWIENAPEYQNIDPPYICSECGNMHLRKTNYCDQCGVRMFEPQESEVDK